MPPSRRDELIDAAMRVFYRHGFSTGIDTVLREGGISRMTLYNHFKSKDELIIAALRRRDEMFRNRLMKFVEAKGADPVGRILGVFDFLSVWFGEDDFRGCMFINASAEFDDPKTPVRRLTAEHKTAITEYLCRLCEAAGLASPRELAEQLDLLVEGSIVWAQVIGQVELDGRSPGTAAGRARAAAEVLIDAAR